MITVSVSTESPYGWGGPIAVLVAGVIMALFHFVRVELVKRGKIDNPSPTTGREGYDDDTLQLRGDVSDIDIALDDEPEGDVDLDEIEEHGWGSISRERRREDRMTLDDWIMDNLPELGYRRTASEGAAAYGVSVRTVTRRIAELRGHN